MAHNKKVAFFMAALASLLVACAGAAALIAPPTDTPVLSATPEPTSTPEPTLTPYPLPTIVLPTGMPTYDLISPEAFSCRVRKQSVSSRSKFDPKEQFDMAWQVQNTGQALWDPDRVEFAYFSGSKLHVSSVSRLQVRVDPGDTTLLVTDMRAPRSSGAYTTTWALRYGAVDFCHVSLTIVVR